MKKLLLVFTLCLFLQPLLAQVTTTVNPTIAQLQQKLSGNGITITNVSITCPDPTSYALYSGGTGTLSSLSSGILLTTGSATSVAGPNDATISNAWGMPGSVLGNSLSAGTTSDACYIKFEITPTCQTLSINYMFASNEYSDFVGIGANDVFGFILDGPNPAGGNYVQQNIAIVPGTALPVSIDNVNNGVGFSAIGVPPTGPCTNCQYFQDQPSGMVYNGATSLMTASAVVTPCSNYTMTIGVWDVLDDQYDSAVFLDVNGISCAGSPSLTAAISNSVLCSTQSVTLSAGGGLAGGTYTWSAPASGGLSAAPGPTVTANPTGNATYTLSYSDVNSCPGVPLTKMVNVTFTTSPAFPVTQSPTGTVCAGNTATLSANGGAGTYTWSAGTTPVVASGSVVTVTPGSTTTYTVTKTTGSTCPSSTVVTVTVAPPVQTSVTATSTFVCAGQSLTINATGAGPFSWTASSGANPTTTTSAAVVTPTISTNYTVVSGIGTCTTIATKSITVGTPGTISVTPSNTTICAGKSVTLSNSGFGPYTWTASSGANPPATQSVIVTPTANTTYTILSGTGACTATAVANVSIIAIPSVSVTPNFTTICNGGFGTGLNALGASNYTWMPANSGLSNYNNPSVISNPTITATYTVVGAVSGCTNSAVATVSVITVSTSVTASSFTYCIGGPSVSLSGSGATNYTWTSSSSLSTNTTPSISASPSITTTYTLSGQTGNCSLATTFTITVPPVLTLTTSATQSLICLGTTGSSLSVTGAETYTWFPSLSTDSTIFVNPVTTTDYTVVGQSNEGCFRFPAIITITVATLATPTIVTSSYTVCPNKPITLSEFANDATLNYTWTPQIHIAGFNTTSSVTAQPITSANVIYTLTTSNGTCFKTDTIEIDVVECDPPEVDIHNLTDTSICSHGCVSFEPIIHKGTPPFTYQWLFPSGTLSAGSTFTTSTPESCYNTPGEYDVKLVVINAYGSDTVLYKNYIDVVDSPSVVHAFYDTIIKIQDFTTINVTGATTYQWFSYPEDPTLICNTCASTIVQPTVTTNYVVYGYNSKNCWRKDTVTITIDDRCSDLFVPNVFSPNGDGLNDKVNVNGYCILSFNLQIFNRWGERVFETKDKTLGWDGTYKGKALDADVFVYRVDGLTIDNKPFQLKGNVTLLR